jgi:Zn-dependent protease with chaperone function
MHHAPFQFNRSSLLFVLQRFSFVTLICLIGVFPAFPQDKQETLNGYAEYFKNGFLIVEGQRVYASPSTKFKKVNGLEKIPLGSEIKIKAIRQSDGSMLATEVETKPNGSALFESQAWVMTNQWEKLWVDNGMMLVQTAEGNWVSRGRIISEGLQVARVQNIMARLLPPYIQANRLRVRVIENEEWNASAMANGAIWVHTSLLRDMSDDELAIILGHELGHFSHEHTRRQMKKAMWINMAGAAAQGATNNAQAQQYIALASLAWKNTYSREHEDQADRVGLRYAYEGGFDVIKGHRVWQRFLEKYGESDKLNNLIYGSHSLSSERLRNLQKEIEWNYLKPVRQPAAAYTTVPFAGEYSGEWVARLTTGENHEGTWRISISANGEIIGIEHDKTSKQQGAIKGLIGADGLIEVFLTYSGETGTIKGTLTRNENQLRGLLKQDSGGKTVALIAIDLKRQ